ncbi:MAG: hypothetical protein ACK54U_03470 [Sphingomonadales bacterium]|jgi:hypothetical protein
MTDTFSTLTEKLARHPELQWEAGDGFVRVNAPVSGGFALELQHQGGEWTVFLGSGGWHQHFDDGADALEFIAWCYSGNVRVREVWRGTSLQKSVLETQVDGAWRQTSHTGYFLVPFWRKKTEVIMQNPDLLAPA